MGEKGDGYGFNKRRAEGRDGSEKFKSLQLKARKLNPINTLCYAQILGTGLDTQDTSPSVLLFFDKQRFIFNAGEGLQRFCTEHKIKLSKIDHIFFTRVCSETAGGLPGLLLTLAGIGDEGISVNIWGSSDLNYLIAAMRNFVPNAAMVHVHSFGDAQEADEPMVSTSAVRKFSDPITLVDDEVVSISAIPLRPSHANGSNLRPGEIAVVYSCELTEIKGKFDPAKAAALGLRPGPKYRDLQLGKSVKSDSLDELVHPNQVLGPSIPGPIVLLVDCPTPSHMAELFSAESLTCYYTESAGKQKENYKHVNCIIHLGPASITKSVDYQKWMKRFGGAQHILAGHEMKNMKIPILQASARISSRLNYLCPQLFPAPGYWSAEHINSMALDSSEPCEGASTHWEGVPAENLLKFHLRPYSMLGLDRTAIPRTLSHKEVVAELISEIPEVSDALAHINEFIPLEDDSMLRQNNLVAVEPTIGFNSGSLGSHTTMDYEEGKVKQDSHVPPCLHNITREDMEIVLLGTGSSQPSKYRNVSSVFINLFSRGSILLDCGEGTLGQIKRRFGVKGADDAVKCLRCIWISHIHADHHTGLARVLALRSQLLKDVPHEPLLVIGPRQLKRFLDAYSRLEDLDMHFLDCRHTLEACTNFSSENLDARDNSSSGTNVNSSIRMHSFLRRPGSPIDKETVLPILSRLNEVLSEAGLDTLHSVPVVHCPQAFGVVLKAKDRLTDAGEPIPGWKLVYSGDSRPCQALIDASRDATVLIHEATFEETMIEEAIAKNHSTTKEAIAVGTAAGAYRIVLTHFSQRYPKIPVFDESEMQKTCIAFDLMSINLADLPVLPKFLPYLKLLFKNEMITDESEDIQESAM